MTFKSGQKVIAVQSAVRVPFPKDSITKGQVYTVSRTEEGGDDVYLEGKTQHFSASRFEAYSEPVPVLDFTKPLETQNGQPVTIISMEARGEYSVLAYIGEADTPSSFTTEGKFFRAGKSDYDLRNVAPKPVEREVYVNVNTVGSRPMSIGGNYDSRAEADSSASPYRVACIKITLVEGQFDD